MAELVFCTGCQYSQLLHISRSSKYDHEHDKLDDGIHPENEGASKGILVTTSGYGKASYEFADGKPLELLSGSNLLYLLKEHAEIEAKIQMPEDWNDPSPALRANSCSPMDQA